MALSPDEPRIDFANLPAPAEGITVTHFLVVRNVARSRAFYADIQAVYGEWSERGAEFLTPPQDRGAEIRCYIRDPDGHLIEVGQTKGTP